MGMPVDQPPSDTEAIYAAYFDYVWASLRRLGVPRSQLEDACHDVFLVAHRRAADYDGRCAMKTWLFGISRRVASDHRRRSQRERERRARLALVERGPVHPDEVWSGRVWMRDFLGRLQPDQRDAYVMLELEQMTAREASALSGVNANTLAARLRAARSHLETSLAAEHASLDVQELVKEERRAEPAPEPARRRVLAGLLPLWSTGLPLGPAAKGAGAGIEAGRLASGIGVKGWIAAAAMLLTVVAVDAPRAAVSPIEPEVRVVAVAHRVPVREPSPSSMPASAAEFVASPPSPAPMAPVPDPTPSPSASAQPVPPLEPAPPSEPPSAVETPSPRPRRTSTRPSRSEVELLPGADDLTAQTELAGRVFASDDPEQIVRLVEEYRRRFGRGFHGDRLAVHEIEALCRLGRTARARTRIESLRRRAAPLAQQARRRCDRSTTAVTKTGGSRHQDGS